MGSTGNTEGMDRKCPPLPGVLAEVGVVAGTFGEGVLGVTKGEGCLDEGADSSLFPVLVGAPEMGDDFFPPSKVLRKRVREDLGMTEALEWC